MLSTVSLNGWAILVAGLISMPLGALWYSPAMFGKKFMKLTGMSADSMKTPANKKSAQRGYMISSITALIMAYILAHFVGYTNSTTAMEGLQTGFWVWLGFVITTNIGVVLWERRPFELYLINMGYSLVQLLIMGAILAAWR